MLRFGIWSVVILANAVALFCATNPWIDRWRSQGVAFFLIEAILLVIVYVPVVLYQHFVKKRSIGDSFTAAAHALMNILSGIP